MDYEVFKQVMADRIKDYLPPLFHSYEVSVCTVRKINQEKDALVVMPGEKRGIQAAPNIYLDDMYQAFRQSQDLDQVLRLTSSMILRYTGSFCPDEIDLDFSKRQDSIVMNLINTRRNKALLDMVPHRDFLDLSVIYRFIMDRQESGLSTVLLTDSLMEEIQITEDVLFEQAKENTERLFPVKFMQMSETFCVMTNEVKIHGAATVLYKTNMEKLETKMNGSFYLLPSSVHEMIAVPDGVLTPQELLHMLEEGNRTYGPADEILSDSVYHYDHKNGCISIAASCCAEAFSA